MLNQPQLRALLKPSGLKLSRIRGEIIGLLNEFKQPLSYMEIRQKLSGVKPANLFNELEILQRHGLIEPVVSGSGESCFVFTAVPRKRQSHCQESCAGASGGTKKIACGGTGSCACGNKNQKNPLSST